MRAPAVTWRKGVDNRSRPLHPIGTAPTRPHYQVYHTFRELISSSRCSGVKKIRASPFATWERSLHASGDLPVYGLSAEAAKKKEERAGGLVDAISYSESATEMMKKRGSIITRLRATGY